MASGASSLFLWEETRLSSQGYGLTYVISQRVKTARQDKTEAQKLLTFLAPCSDQSIDGLKRKAMSQDMLGLQNMFIVVFLRCWPQAPKRHCVQQDKPYTAAPGPPTHARNDLLQRLLLGDASELQVWAE